MRIFVIGGINMDICGIPGTQLRQNDSNPGRITLNPGGLSRNVAENLVHLGAEVELVTVFGSDAFAKELEQNCIECGIGIKYAVHTEGRSCLHVAVRADDGNAVAVVTDMDIMEEIDVPYLESIIDEINAADACIMEASLSIESIEYLAQNVTVPIFADPVSTTKSVKLRGVLDKLYCIKPSRAEASALTGIDLHEDRSTWVAAEVLIEQGVKRVFITLGNEGILYADKIDAGLAPAVRVHAENRIGAGDSVTAAICYASVMGMSLEECAAFANKAGCMTIQTEEIVNKEIGIILDPDADLHEISEMEDFLADQELK